MDSLFFCNVNRTGRISRLIDTLESYSKENSRQVYIIKQALGLNNIYEYQNAAVILIPKHKIVILNYGPADNDAFNVFCQDFIEDLSFLSAKYDYMQALGRTREWSQLIIQTEYNDDVDDIQVFLNSIRISGFDERKVDFLISLLIGSINDIEKVGSDNPKTTLDKIKQKIVLFDGMQSRFIYEDVQEKRITIQGLAGTGKTELLLHKLQKIFVLNKNSRIAFTCHNKVLANDMKKRIPRFFDFMKVEQQIDWNERLWVFPSWGSQSDKYSGLYSFICDFYDISFKRLRDASFEKACMEAVEELRNRDTIDYCFDYIFVDESQDFSNHFFVLCEMITKEKVFIAGDIFQNIFDANFANTVNCTYLLNKCYRTDPKTLMFAHSVGMGLYENPVIRWLDEQQWIDCGYSFERQNSKVILKRSPIRRFEDLDNMNSIQVIPSSVDDFISNIIGVIKSIQDENPTVTPDDIAIVFPGSTKSSYDYADKLDIAIFRTFGWESCKGYETKRKGANQVFISNKNNIKGLEFPFVICVQNEYIGESILQRNSIYMILTRSFLISYFIINSINSEFLDIYTQAARDINQNGYMKLREPSIKEIQDQETKIQLAVNSKKKSVEEIIIDVCEKHNIKDSDIVMLQDMVPKLIANETEEEVTSKTKAMISMLPPTVSRK